MVQFPAFTYEVVINASAQKVWDALTLPYVMKQWMSETEIEIETSWTEGSPITMHGPWYKTSFKNTGTVRVFCPLQHLQYTHLSSLSRLRDKPGNYVTIDFVLTGDDNAIKVALTLDNFPTEAIYRHMVFYWRVALHLLKRVAEGQPAR